MFIAKRIKLNQVLSKLAAVIGIHYFTYISFVSRAVLWYITIAFTGSTQDAVRFELQWQARRREERVIIYKDFGIDMKRLWLDTAKE